MNADRFAPFDCNGPYAPEGLAFRCVCCGALFGSLVDTDLHQHPKGWPVVHDKPGDNGRSILPPELVVAP